MGVALGHADLGMPEQPLDHIERHILVNQETGERVTHIDLRLKGGSCCQYRE